MFISSVPFSLSNLRTKNKKPIILSFFALEFANEKQKTNSFIVYGIYMDQIHLVVIALVAIEPYV